MLLANPLDKAVGKELSFANNLLCQQHGPKLLAKPARALGGKPKAVGKAGFSPPVAPALPTALAIRPLPCAMLKTHGKDNVPAAGMVTLPCAGQKTHGKVTYIFLFFFTFSIPIQTKSQA
jgi:hypothetical protein